MGLLDTILGNMMGSGANTGKSRSSAMSPLVKAILMMLAAKAYQNHRSGGGGGAGLPGGLGGMLGGGGLGGMLGGGQGPMRGGLGGLLTGGLGGLLGGLAGGRAPGGDSLGGLIDQFRTNGYGDHVDSWIGTGQNRAISPDALSQALGADTLDELEQYTGLPRQQLLTDLSDELPDAVDQFTPAGRLPTEEEVSSRWV